MGQWELTVGESDEWYTPAYIFDALGETFDLDVAAPPNGGPFVPAKRWFSHGALEHKWEGFVWMNPPFGARNGIAPWLDKFFSHGYGIALGPDRTSAPWWQDAMGRADAVLFTAGKVRFYKPDLTQGKSPGNGTTLFASGRRAVKALLRAERVGLGVVLASPLI